MPVHLVVNRSTGDPQKVEIPVSAWFTGEKTASVRIAREPTINAPLNGVAPHPVTNREFTKTLARVLNRPSFMPVWKNCS